MQPRDGEPCPTAQQGMSNFRDVGGETGFGDTILPSNWLFRSDAPPLHSARDAELLQEAEIGIIVDLRSALEQPERPPALRSCCRYISVKLGTTDWPDGALGPADMAAFLAGRYLTLAEQCLHGGITLGTGLTALLEPTTVPRIVWCTGGKDRTGLVIGITLRLLGVPDGVICADYARSALAGDEIRRRARTAPSRSSPPIRSAAERRAALRQSLAGFQGRLGYLSNSAPPEAITLFLRQLAERYGSVEHYAELTGLDLELVARTRQMLSARTRQAAAPPLPAAGND